MLRASNCIFSKYVEKLVYYAYIYLLLTYSLAVWDNVAKVHINRILILQKQAIRSVYEIKRLNHVAPIAYKNCISLFTRIV